MDAPIKLHRAPVNGRNPVGPLSSIRPNNPNSYDRIVTKLFQRIGFLIFRLAVDGGDDFICGHNPCP